MTKERAELMVDEIEQRFPDVYCESDKRRYIAANGDKRYDYDIKVIGKSGSTTHFKSHIDWLEFIDKLEVFGLA